MPSALLLIDVINPFDFEGAHDMIKRAEAAAERIDVLKRRAIAERVPVIYCNDHFGAWKEDFADLVERCRHPGVTGSKIANLLAPDGDDLYVLKPRHSAFFETPLATLLDQLGVDRLILCGFTGDMCVLATAMDAHMRRLELAVPADCIASLEPEHDRQTLEYVRRVFDANTDPGEEIRLA